MASIKLVTYFKIALEDKPGTVLAVAEDLKAKNIGLLALYGYGTLPGQSELYCIPKNPDKFRAAFKSASPTLEEGSGLLLKGEDKTGAMVKALVSIASAGVNMEAMYAIAAGGRYGSVIRIAPADVEKAAKALGVKKP
jgi:hypothetical protein